MGREGRIRVKSAEVGNVRKGEDAIRGWRKEWQEKDESGRIVKKVQQCNN